MRAERVLGRARRLELRLVRERQARDVGEADGVVTGELVAVEGGALEQVRELLAKACVVERELLGPRPSLDVGIEDHS